MSDRHFHWEPTGPEADLSSCSSFAKVYDDESQSPPAEEYHAPAMPMRGTDAAHRVQAIFAGYHNPLRFIIETRGDYIALAAKGVLGAVPKEALEIALGRSVSITEYRGMVGILVHPAEYD